MSEQFRNPITKSWKEVISILFTHIYIYMIIHFHGGEKNGGVRLVLWAQISYSEISIIKNKVIFEFVLWCQSCQTQNIEDSLFALIITVVSWLAC